MARMFKILTEMKFFALEISLNYVKTKSVNLLEPSAILDLENNENLSKFISGYYCDIYKAIRQRIIF